MSARAGRRPRRGLSTGPGGGEGFGEGWVVGLRDAAQSVLRMAVDVECAMVRSAVGVRTVTTDVRVDHAAATGATPRERGIEVARSVKAESHGISFLEGERGCAYPARMAMPGPRADGGSMRLDVRFPVLVREPYLTATCAYAVEPPNWSNSHFVTFWEVTCWANDQR